MPDRAAEDLLRELAPQVLGALVRRYDNFELCEDAVQEALLAAALRWPTEGVPANPRGWLITVATRRLIDQVRSEQAMKHREIRLALATPYAELLSRPADSPAEADHDDSLALLFMCCHPALSVPSRIALTLRAVGGLTTAQFAAAFLVPETTMAQRISRAKQAIKASGTPFALPDAAERAQRLDAVLHVLYLIFNEGYATSDGAEPTAPALSTEAIRLTRLLHRLLPDDAEGRPTALFGSRSLGWARGLDHRARMRGLAPRRGDLRNDAGSRPPRLAIRYGTRHPSSDVKERPRTHERYLRPSRR